MYHFYSQTFKSDPKSANYFKVKIPKDGLYYIIVSQQVSTNPKDNHYSSVFMVLGKKKWR